MNNKLKRCTAAGLVVIMLLVGFVAEYTHRHAAPFDGQTTVADANSQQPDKSAGQQISHFCWICQLNSVAVEIVPVIELAILTVQQTPVSVSEFAFLSSTRFDLSLHRGPPAFLA